VCGLLRSGQTRAAPSAPPLCCTSARSPGVSGAGLTELDLPVPPGGEPVDHAAVEVDMGIQRAGKVLHEPHRARAQPLRSVSRASMTRSKMCRTALSASLSAVSFQ
jgi:hypothetical protein